jgi:phenylacetate-coenzyme A ligase PaaK-like adenylate-forming protein
VAETLVAETLDAGERAAVEDAARRAAARFPWYASMLAAAPDVPVLAEPDLATTYYVADSPPEPGERTYLTSGTSTGVRKRVRWTAEDHARYVAHRAELFRRFVGDSCGTACADLGTGHAAASAIEIFEQAGLDGQEIDFTLPVERHIELLRAWRPDLLYAMPMILERIVAAGGPGYVPRRVVVVGDVAPPEWRRAMGKRLGVEPRHMLDVLGSIEVGAIAFSDDAIGGYLFHDHIVPEVIARPQPGHDDAGLLLLTSLERDGFPAVRYASGDLVTGFGRVVAGGRSRWGYRRHLGREGSELKHGEMLSLHAIAIAMAATAPGVAWAVRRQGMEVVIEIDEVAFSASIAAAVRAAVREAHPAVDQMIRSGLVGDIAVEPRTFAGVPAKRSIVTR